MPPDITVYCVCQLASIAFKPSSGGLVRKLSCVRRLEASEDKICKPSMHTHKTRGFGGRGDYLGRKHSTLISSDILATDI